MSDFKSSVTIRPSVRQVTLLPDNHLIHSIVSIRYKLLEYVLYEICNIVLVLLGIKFTKRNVPILWDLFIRDGKCVNQRTLIQKADNDDWSLAKYSLMRGKFVKRTYVNL